MKRLLALAAIVLLGLTGCEIITDPDPKASPTPSGVVIYPEIPIPIPPQDLPADLPADAIPVLFEIRVYDEDGDEVIDEMTGDFKMTGLLFPDDSDDVARNATIIDMQTGNPVESPHEWEQLLPLVGTQLVGQGVMSLSIEALVPLGPWWHAHCRVSVEGITVYQTDPIVNDSALPTDHIVICLWP